MRLRCLLPAIAFLAVAVPVARTDDKTTVPDGNWILSTPMAFGDSAVCLLKSEVKDGKLAIVALATPPSIEATVSDVKAEPSLRFKLKTVQTVKDRTGKERKFTNEREFVAAPGGSGKEILGSFGSDTFNTRAKLTPTDSEKLTTLLVRGPAATTMQTAQGLSNKAAIAQNKYRQEKDKEKKKELKAEADSLRKDADAKLPDLFRGVIKEHPADSGAYQAAYSLLADSENAKVTVEEATALVKLILKQAEPYGPRFSQLNASRLADSLVRTKGLESVALIPVEPIAKGLKDSDKLGFQFDTLTTYQRALDAAKRTDDAKALEPRLAKLDLALDKEYHETVPPFKPKTFPGRESNRVAVMELFTGAQCGPCIAADVAFDALEKAYQPKDLVLIQYHMHIPGPDPLTSPAAVARWDYYSDLFPYDPDNGSGIGGTPSTLFNGKPLAGGGGGMDNAENKFNDYRKIIDPLLAKSSDIKLTGTATRDGDAIALAVQVSGAPAKDGLKLKLLLVEDTIKYVGGNKIRFHHQVVRAMPGGADGVTIKESTLKHEVKADVAAIRKELVSYLDEYAAKQRPFPYKSRPLDLKDLKAIALVQNHETGEIVQAIQFDIATK